MENIETAEKVNNAEQTTGTENPVSSEPTEKQEKQKTRTENKVIKPPKKVDKKTVLKDETGFKPLEVKQTLTIHNHWMNNKDKATKRTFSVQTARETGLKENQILYAPAEKGTCKPVAKLHFPKIGQQVKVELLPGIASKHKLRNETLNLDNASLVIQGQTKMNGNDLSKEGFPKHGWLYFRVKVKKDKK